MNGLVRGLNYARISRKEAKLQTVPNIVMQHAENHEYAAIHDIEIVASLDDNLTASRFSTKDRPGFLKLMDLVRASAIDVILVTEQSRLDRQLWSILELIELARTTSFKKIILTRDDEVRDLSTEASINAVIEEANRNRHESEQTSQRIRYKKKVRAREGYFNGGRRCYGFEKDGVTPRESEVMIIREVADKLRAGVPQLTIVRDLNARRIPTASGAKWRVWTIEQLFASKRLIGVRVHNGVEYTAKWPAILTRGEFDEIQLILKSREHDKSRRTGKRSYVLTGYAECGNCGKPMRGFGHCDAHGVFQRRYWCHPIEADGSSVGCGKVARLAEPVEALVREAVLHRLGSKPIAEAFAAASSNGDIQAANQEFQTTKRQLGGLLRDYYQERNEYARREMAKIKVELEAQLERLGERISRLAPARRLASLSFDQSAREIWEEADLSLRQQLIGLVIEKVVILPGRPGSQRWTDTATGRTYHFDPSKIQIHWKS